MSFDISSLYHSITKWPDDPTADDTWISPGISQQSAPGDAVHFATPGCGLSVNFGVPLTSGSSIQMDGQSTPGNTLSQLVGVLINKLMAEVTQMMQGQRRGTQETTAHYTNASATPPSSGNNTTSMNNSHAVVPLTQTTSTDGASGPLAGSGPRAFNITNTQDHDINIGQFDQHNKLIGEITLKPGESGQMRYHNDFTGLLKQADANGNYRDDASRLEFYNGFINTSDIDGRNAAIYATDHQGFEIGDHQSIADRAPADIISTDSSGNKTIAGYYDGSSSSMRKGSQFMTDTLGTSMTYMHPEDDRLPEGQNPMRHTDAMTLDVIFSKA